MKDYEITQKTYEEVFFNKNKKALLNRHFMRRQNERAKSH